MVMSDVKHTQGLLENDKSIHMASLRTPQSHSARPDIVIAYARADRGALADCSAALAQRGYAVWWDREMTAGRKWREQFDEQVDRARKVIVIWSEAAAKSKE